MTSPHHPQIQPYPPVPATASAEPQTTTHKYGPISRSPYRAVCRTRQITDYTAQHAATGRPNRCSCNPPKTGAPRYTPIRDPPQPTRRTLPKIPTQHRTAVSNRPSSPADTTASVRCCNPPSTPLPRCARNRGFPPHTYQPTTQKAAEPMWIPRPTAYAAPPRRLIPATDRLADLANQGIHPHGRIQSAAPVRA